VENQVFSGKYRTNVCSVHLIQFFNYERIDFDFKWVNCMVCALSVNKAV
jgi:hypothetical protein